MARSKLIVIWDSESVVSAYLESFLAVNIEWKVILLKNKEELDHFTKSIETLKTEIILIAQNSPNNTINIPLKAIQDHPDIKVILFSYENNTLDVYCKQKIKVQQASDLINVIDHPSSPAGGLVMMGGEI